MCFYKLIVAVSVCLILNSFSQDVAPELVKPQAQYKAVVEKIEAQKLTAIAKAAKSYLSALAAEEKKALNAGKVDIVAAITKERSAALSGEPATELPAEIPSGMRIKNARKSSLSSLKRVQTDYSKRRGKLDADYLKYLSKLHAKHASNDELVKQIAEEKAAVLQLAADAKTAEKEEVAKKDKKVARGKNVVVNGDFEQVVDGKPVGWERLDQAITVVTEKGNSFLRINAEVANKDGIAPNHVIRFLKNIPVPKNAKTITLSTKLRTKDCSVRAKKNPKHPHLSVCFESKGKNAGYRCTRWNKKNGPWQMFKLQEDIPVNAEDIRVAIMNGYCTGQMDFDDIEVSFK